MENKKGSVKPQFEQGDVVTLKSGGLKMTVSRYFYGDVICQWFDDQGNLKERLFPEKLLKVAEKSND